MEQTYTISLRKTFDYPKTYRSNFATKAVKDYLKKKLKLSDVRVDNSINEAIWGTGIRTPPRTIRVKIKEEDGVKTAVLAE
jgi:large subunit ribosomal protein L31e